MHPRYRQSTLFLLALLLASPMIRAENWSRFRGPNGSGVAEAANFPTAFGPETNLQWKAAVRPGRSSPVLTTQHVFLTAFGDEKLYTQCFDRKSGKLLWERSIDRPRKAVINKLNDPAALTPVTDGENVYAFFEDWGLLSYDGTGNLRWKTPLGPFTNSHGLGISPILADGLLIVQVDQLVDSYIAAFDAANGETVWKTKRTETEGWSTPVLYRPAGAAPQVLTVSDRLLGAHQLKNGERTFTETGIPGNMVASPVLDGATLYTFGYNFENPLPFDEQLRKLDKNGDGKLGPEEYQASLFLTGMAKFRGNRDGEITRTEWEGIMEQYSGPSRLVAMRLESGAEGKTVARELWHEKRSLMYVIPSPLVYDGVLYFVKNSGIFTAVDAETGKMLKEGRLKDAIDPYSASPVAADGKIYLASETGKVSVVRPGADWQVVAVNDLKEGIFATPALSDGKIFIRTTEGLYSFGE